MDITVELIKLASALIGLGTALAVLARELRNSHSKVSDDVRDNNEEGR